MNLPPAPSPEKGVYVRTVKKIAENVKRISAAVCFGVCFGVKSLFLTNYQKIFAYPLFLFFRSFVNHKDLTPQLRS